MDSPLAAFGRIQAMIFDVDGVMTNAQVLVTEEGHLLRSMSVRDGFALKLAIDLGYKIAVITGGSSDGVRDRLFKLGVSDYYSGVHNKLEVFDAYHERHGLDRSQTLYMGDDILDLPALQAAGIACAPADACPEVLAEADYVSAKPGGQGCVRDVIERVLKLQGKWMQV